MFTATKLTRAKNYPSPKCTKIICISYARSTQQNKETIKTSFTEVYNNIRNVIN